MFMGIRVLWNWSICYEIEVISAVWLASLDDARITIAIKYLLQYINIYYITDIAKSILVVKTNIMKF